MAIKTAPMIASLVRGGSDISGGLAALGVMTCCAGGRRSSMTAISLVLCHASSVRQQLQREVAELNELLAGESICERNLELQSGLTHRFDALPPGCREPRLDRATVIGVRHPLHEAGLLEAVDQAGDVARADPLQLGQAAEADAAVADVAEHEEQLEPALAEPLALSPALLHPLQVPRRRS